MNIYIIEVFDVLGRRVYTGILRNEIEIPFKVGSGSYILILRDVKTGKRVKRKIIKIE